MTTVKLNTQESLTVELIGSKFIARLYDNGLFGLPTKFICRARKNDTEDTISERFKKRLELCNKC